MHDTVINLLDEVKQLWMATDSLKKPSPIGLMI